VLAPPADGLEAQLERFAGDVKPLIQGEGYQT
jgi:hypothetical protein